MHLVGLRFRRRDAPRLLELADRVRGGELNNVGGVNQFDAAAMSAMTDEPMQIPCHDPRAAERLADKYVRFGITRPAVEQLSTPGG